MFKKLILIGFTSVLTNTIWSQEVWTLERCVTYAQENNRQVKQSIISVKNAKLSNKQDGWSRYPSVSANSNLGFNFGRSVNPSTYTFENSATNYNSWGLNINAPIFTGGRISNQIKQSALDVKAAEADLETTSNNIGLQVAQAYLQILLNEEQLENAKKRASTTVSQLERTEKQIRAGQLPQNARYDLQAQVARDDQSIVTASNNLDLSYLNLKNLLELSPETEMKIERPNFVIPSESNPDGIMFKEVYNLALGNQPQIRAAQYRIKSAEMAVKVAQANRLPTLSASANLNTNYSSTINDLTKPDLSGAKLVYNSPVPAKVDNKDVQFTSSSVTGVSFPQKAYVKQVSDNFGQGIGLNLSIPIFSGFSRQISVERQRLNVESQNLALEREKQQLKTDVQNAIASARAAKRSYDASLKSYEALKAAFEASEKRFQIGNANSFEFTQAKNNLDAAERDVTVAKYDYLFRLKIVDFYEGKKLKLD